MNLFEQVLHKNQNNLENIFENSLKILHNDLFKLVEKIGLDLEITHGFIDKVQMLEEELIEPQMLNINLLPFKKNELNSYKTIIDKKSLEISSSLKIIFPILFSNSSSFRKNLQILFSKATICESRDEASKKMVIILESLDEISDLYNHKLKFNSLYICLNEHNIFNFREGIEELKLNLSKIHDLIFELKVNKEIFN